MLIVIAALSALMGALKLLDRWAHPPAELTRKLLHVGMGSVVLSFPWVFHQQWPVMILAVLSAGALLATKQVRFLRDGVGTVLNKVGRTTLGEVYFPVAVGVVFFLSGRDKLLYCVPMLIMTLADAMAALIGIAYGKVRYLTSEGLKSAEGSIAFFSIAFLSVHVPLLLFTAVGRAQTLLLAIIIGVLSMLLEAIAFRGLDNLLIPVGAFAFLKLYLHKSVPDLELRLLITFVMLVFALSWRRRSSLDDSALMAGAFFGYGAWMLGGPLWLIGPAVLFLTHAIVWPRSGQRREHTVYAVLSVISCALLWLGLYVGYGDRFWFFPFAVTFGVHLAIIAVSQIPVTEKPGRAWARLAISIFWGWLLAAGQIWVFLILGERLDTHALLSQLVLTIPGIAAGAFLFFQLRPRLYGGVVSATAVHTAGFAAGLLGAVVGMLGMVLLR
jgi:phytol kinase